MSILRGLVVSVTVMGLATPVMTGCAERPGVKKEDKDKDKDKDEKKKDDEGGKKTKKK